MLLIAIKFTDTGEVRITPISSLTRICRSLTSAGRLLEAQGYRIAAILSDEDDPERAPSDPASYWLQVEKVECHSVDSLLAREEQLREFARMNGLKGYDGVEVGAVPTIESLPEQ